MKTLSITLEDSLYKQLREIAQVRQVSNFVAEAIRAHIEAKIAELAREYTEAEKDAVRMVEINEWSALDAEGWQ